MGRLRTIAQVCGLVVFSIILGGGMLQVSKAEAVDRNLVRVSADNDTLMLSTKAATTADALEEFGIELAEFDVVEPKLDTQIQASPFHINVYRAEPVRIADGSKTIDVMSAYQSPRLIAKHVGIELFPEDLVTMNRIDNFVTEGFVGNKISIKRATKVSLELDGKIFEIRTHAKTVEGVLKDLGLTLGSQDFTTPASSSVLTDSMVISVVRVGHETLTEEISIPFTTDVKVDKSMLVGTQRVEVEGVDGLEIISYELVQHNGSEVSRKQINQATVRAPQNKIIVRGGKIPNPNDNRDIGLVMASERGWIGPEWVCLEKLWTKESQWRSYADNPNSSAYGIPQALPGSKMASHGADWATNPKTQIAWGLDYIARRYGSPCQAWGHSVLKNWY